VGRVHPPMPAEKETWNRRQTRAEVAESIHSRGPEAKVEAQGTTEQVEEDSTIHGLQGALQ